MPSHRTESLCPCIASFSYADAMRCLALPVPSRATPTHCRASLCLGAALHGPALPTRKPVPIYAIASHRYAAAMHVGAMPTRTPIDAMPVHGYALPLRNVALLCRGSATHCYAYAVSCASPRRCEVEATRCLRAAVPQAAVPDALLTPLCRCCPAPCFAFAGRRVSGPLRGFAMLCLRAESQCSAIPVRSVSTAVAAPSNAMP